MIVDSEIAEMTPSSWACDEGVLGVRLFTKITFECA
jgi:hypothetical protein